MKNLIWLDSQNSLSNENFIYSIIQYSILNNILLFSVLEDFILHDIRSNGELAFSWLYQEYANCRGFSAMPPVGEKPTLANYDECLTRLLLELMKRQQDQKEAFMYVLCLRGISPHILFPSPLTNITLIDVAIDILAPTPSL